MWSNLNAKGGLCMKLATWMVANARWKRCDGDYLKTKIKLTSHKLKIQRVVLSLGCGWSYPCGQHNESRKVYAGRRTAPPVGGSRPAEFRVISKSPAWLRCCAGMPPGWLSRLEGCECDVDFVSTSLRTQTRREANVKYQPDRADRLLPLRGMHHRHGLADSSLVSPIKYVK